VSRIILRIITATQLTRLTLAFGAISDVWLVILLSRVDVELTVHAGSNLPRMPLWLAMTAGTLAAIGFFAYVTAINDVLDVKRDAAFSPDRPIPAGRIRQGQAVVVAIAALICALLAAAAFGGWSMHLAALTAIGMLFYNATGRFVPAVGIVTIGLIQGLHMLIPNAEFAFMLPVWTTVTHGMTVMAAVHVFASKRPPLSKRGIVGAATGWVIVTVAIFAVAKTRGGLWPIDRPLILLVWPGLAAASFVGLFVWVVRRGEGRVVADRLIRLGAVWQSFLAASWLAVAGLHVAAVSVAVLAVMGLGAMLLAETLTSLIAQPLNYRS